MTTDSAPEPVHCFGQRLAAILAERRLSYYALARLVGMTDQALINISRGADPSFSTALRIAQALEVPITHFAGPEKKSL